MCLGEWSRECSALNAHGQTNEHINMAAYITVLGVKSSGSPSVPSNALEVRINGNPPRSLQLRRMYSNVLYVNVQHAGIRKGSCGSAVYLSEKVWCSNPKAKQCGVVTQKCESFTRSSKSALGFSQCYMHARAFARPRSGEAVRRVLRVGVWCGRVK